MEGYLNNWRTQIRKGYLELCILTLIATRERIHGFDMIQVLAKCGIDVKEGTIYPLLARMDTDGLITSRWEVTPGKGHPRKYYALSPSGAKTLIEMTREFEQMALQKQQLSQNY
jgi:PadR family transcriptional regulator, regulatory protein PadR